MANRRKAIARKTGISSHFLISQTDSRKVDDLPKVGAGRAREALAAGFPDLLCGEPLRQAALERLSASRPFAVLVLRPDEPRDAQAAQPDAAELLPHLAANLAAACRREGGFWGIDDSGLLAAFWPGGDTAQCLALARGLQEEVRSLTGGTVTAGVCAYPLLDFTPLETLENARKAIDHAAFFGPDSRVAFDAVSLNISGDTYYERGEIQSAIREFEHALALDRNNVNVRNSLGVCYAVRGDYERALEEFSAAMRLDGSEYMAVYNLGLIHRLLERRDTALGFFLKANALRADVFEILFQTGKIYLELRQPQAALPYLEQASRLRSKSGAVYRVLGDCYAGLGLSEKAIAAYKKAVKANPGDSTALSALGCLFDEKGENPEIAMVLCKESVRLDPENPVFRRRLGLLFFKMNRLEEALNEFEHAARCGLDTAEDIRRVRERMGAEN